MDSSRFRVGGWTPGSHLPTLGSERMVSGSQFLTLLHAQSHRRVLHYIATTVSRVCQSVDQQDRDRTPIAVCMLSEPSHQVLGRSRHNAGEGKPSWSAIKIRRWINILSQSRKSKWGRGRYAKPSRNLCTRKEPRRMHGMGRWLFKSRLAGRTADPIGWDHGLNGGRCSDRDTSPIHCHPDSEHPNASPCPDPMQVYSRACSVIQMPFCGGAVSTKGSRAHPILLSCHAMERSEVG